MRILGNSVGNGNRSRNPLFSIKRSNRLTSIVDVKRLKNMENGHGSYEMGNRRRRSPTPILSGSYHTYSPSQSPPRPSDHDRSSWTPSQIISRVDYSAGGLRNNNIHETSNADPISIDSIEAEQPFLMSSLKNFGNSCYLNAVLYALRFTPTFLHNLHHLIKNFEIIFDDHESKEPYKVHKCTKTIATEDLSSGINENLSLQMSDDHRVFIELHDIFSQFFALELLHKNCPIEAINLQMAVNKICPSFIPRTQQDSHEFLMCILNCLRDISDMLMNLTSDQPNIFHKIDGDVNSLLSFSFFRDTFTGESQSMTYCLTCETKYNSAPVEMLDLIVPLISIDLDDNFIEKFCLSTEKLSEKYNCTTCDHKTEAKRQTIYPKLPRILIVQLNRFDNEMKKVKIEAPTPLTLKCFCTACIENRKNQCTPEHLYHLYGMIVHLGRMPTSGHYMAYVRGMKEASDPLAECESMFCCHNHSKFLNSNNHTAIDESWYICDDDDITLISKTDFDEKIKIEATTRTPYILFYVRNDLLDNKIID